jgi:hypothetical protein
MTFVREEENGKNGHRASGVWRGGRYPSSLDTPAGALARFGLIDRSNLGPTDFGVVGPTRAKGKKGGSRCPMPKSVLLSDYPKRSVGYIT